MEKKIDDPAETKSVPDVKKALPGDSLTISGSRKQEASDPKAGAEVKGTASELETVNTNQVTAEKKADTTTIQKAATNDPLLDNTLEKRPAAYQKSKVTRRSESSTTEGFGLVFIDEYADGNKDTIRILISNERPVFTTETKAEQKDDRKFLDISSESSTSAPQENKEKAVPRNDCRQVASGNDYEKLRKKMASQSTEEKMTEEAKKVFRTKCFSTEQIRSFSKLYLTNGGKYRFFDEAYPHVTDPETFSTLSGEIKDEYFLNRFKAMLLD